MPPVLAALPLLLCGPILRRVESTQVSVFVATKLRRRVKLALYQYGAGVTGTPQLIGVSPEVETLALGANLHAAVVTFRPTVALVEGVIYGYNINLIRPADAPADNYQPVEDLGSLQLLGQYGLGYGANLLPTFSLAPADLNRLRFVHGSCRKPHAPGTDGLRALDAIIQGTRTDPYARPHHLLLTGDQIYADDVAPALLHELTQLGDLLLGWQPAEILPGVNQPASKVKPSTRRSVLKAQYQEFSSTACDCQLLSFGEYCAMYLFAWSPEVWPPELASFATMFPEAVAVIAQGTPAHEGVSSRDYWAAVALRQQFTESSDALAVFGEGIWEVRRALANVPTLMIFDDHEITDDWYIDYDWKTKTLASPLIRRMITNGLAA